MQGIVPADRQAELALLNELIEPIIPGVLNDGETLMRPTAERFVLYSPFCCKNQIRFLLDLGESEPNIGFQNVSLFSTRRENHLNRIFLVILVISREPEIVRLNSSLVIPFQYRNVSREKF